MGTEIIIFRTLPQGCQRVNVVKQWIRKFLLSRPKPCGARTDFLEL